MTACAFSHSQFADYDVKRVNDAEAGCDALKAALELHFRRWEIENGFRPGSGILLVPAGWQG